MEQQQQADNVLCLFYWKIRGLGAYIQLAFEAAGVTNYQFVGYTEDNEDAWFKRDKPSLTMTLPNLPYLDDGELQISEHDAIFRHVLRKYKPELLGRTLEEQAEVDQFISFWMKTNGYLREFCYVKENPTDEDRKQQIARFDYQLSRIDARLSSRKFHTGDNLTGADLYLYETFQVMKMISPSVATQYPNINKASDAVEELDWFKAYRASPRWFTQFNGDEAYINNKQ